MTVLATLGLTLLLAIVLRWAGARFIPLLMPRSRLRTVGVGWLGGLAGNLAAQVTAPGPEVAGVSLWGAVAGAALAILVLGLYPFLRIMVGRT